MLQRHFKSSIATAAALLCATLGAQATVDNLLPKPHHLEITGPAVRAERPVVVEFVDSIPGAREQLLVGYEPEAYQLSVSDSLIRIKAVSSRGEIRARQTLAQLREGGGDMMPSVEIVDWPAFPLRGYMHDTGRSYIPFDTLLTHIDRLARFKVNTFHWHLTENQAWRMAIDAFPQLTADTSMIRHAGQYYTKDEARRLEAYAAERGITVIPEIDMPGHSRAFTHAMGFDMQSPEGEEALNRILDEVAEAFPLAPWIHIGGDEVPIVRAGFLRRMTDKVRSLGRHPIVWNPIRGTEIGDTVGAEMTQMWSSAGRLVKGLPNIDCRYVYANHFDPYADVASVFRSKVYYQPEATPEVVGSIIAFWNDRNLPDAKMLVRDNSFYPSVLAMADRTWRGGGDGYFEDMGCVLPFEGPQLEEFADWERRFLYHKDHSLATEPIVYAPQSQICWAISDPIPLDSAFTDHAPTQLVRGATVYLRHTWGDLVPGVFREVKPGVKVRANARVWSSRDTTVGAYIETQNYSRSERDLAPEAGKWDRRGSEVRVNGELIAAPNWANAGRTTMSNEDLLLDENATAREPQPIHLRQGWNDIELILPYVDAPGVRLTKWMFTFAFDVPSSGYDENLHFSQEPAKKN